MLRSYLKTAIRNLGRAKIHAAINISGLAIGIACCLMLLLHVQNELSYDKFHEKHERIYRLYQINRHPEGHEWTRSITGSAPGYRLKSDFPQVEKVVRFIGGRKLVSAGNKKLYEDRVFYADAEVFDVFCFHVTKGDPATALNEPFTIAISESIARKYFQTADPVGKTLSIDDHPDYEVTAVFEDIPAQSHLKFDLLASMRTLARNPSFNDDWQNATRTYVLLSEGATPELLRTRMAGFVRKYRDEETAATLNYGLQPLADVHLNPTSVDIDDTVSITKLYLFGVLAAFILAIAIVNFINLSTAQYARRIGEVSIRKVLGASRDHIRLQFMAESTVLVVIATVLAVVLVELFLPVFQVVAQTQLEIHYIQNPFAILGLAGLAALVGIGGGAYPAFVLSKRNPVEILRKTLRSGRGWILMRRTLVVFQFTISAALILSATVVYNQYSFLSQKDLGFETDRLVKIPVERSMLGRVPGLKTRLSELSGVEGVTASTYGRDYGVSIKPAMSDKSYGMIAIFTDHNFIETMGLEIVQGRDFPAEYEANGSRAIIFNRKALDYIGDEISVGENVMAYVGNPEDAGPHALKTVIGIVENFHFRSISEFKMQPMALVIDPTRTENLLVNINDKDPSYAIGSIRDVYTQFAPDRPFEFTFLETELRLAFADELRQSVLFGYACVLAVFVALIGLFGLVKHLTQQRTKEIGIRKVCGASSQRIVTMLTGEFLLLVAVANLIALPIAWYFLKDWLQHYPYRIDLGAVYFILTASASFVLAFLTVSYQSLSAAGANPVDALRYE